MRKILICLLGGLSMDASWAETKVVDGVVWDYSIINGEARVTHRDDYSGDLVVPSSIAGVPVTSIGGAAFRWCESVTSVVIPEGVKDVYANAFYGCKGLKTVTLPNSVTNLGSSAFEGCVSLTSAKLSEGVRKLKTETFANCKKLNSLILQKGLVEIEEGAFENCFDLEVVTLPDGLEKLGKSAFRGCLKLQTITIPVSVVDIGVAAFSGCEGLGEGIVIRDGCVLCVNGECPENVELPEGTRLIAGGALSYYRLHSIRIHEGLTHIGDYAFKDCGFMALSPCGSNYYMAAELPQSVVHIGAHAFEFCSFDRVVLPNGVREIGDYAFYNCYTLESVVLPDGLKDIGDYAFGECDEMQTLTVPSTVTNIGSCAFWLCESLASSIRVPEGVTDVASSTFHGCSSLPSVVIPRSVQSIGFNSFACCYQLKDIYFEGMPPTGVGNGGYSRIGEDSDVTIWYDSSYADAWKKVAGLGARANLREMPTYIVRCLANGGVGSMDDQRFVYIEERELERNSFLRIGYRFSGWAESADGEVAYTDGERVSCLTAEANGVVPLYAVWVPNSYKIRFFANGGNGDMPEVDCEYATEVHLPSNVFRKEGHSFAGWARTAGGCAEFADCSVVSNLTDQLGGVCGLYAAWTANVYKVRFDLAGHGTRTGGGALEQDVRYGASAEEPVVADAPGWVFVGWETDFDDVKSDLIVRAVYDRGWSDGEASDEDVDGVTWRCLYEAGSFRIGRCSQMDGRVVVPLSICDIPLTAIGERAFELGVDITEIVLPEGVTSIGANAFAGCTKLKRITFPTNMEIRRERLYEWGLTDEFIAGYRMGDFIVINTTVLEYVGDRAVTSLTIPSGTTVIEDEALAGLDNLAAVRFAGTERVLGARAFKDCVSLEAVELPECLEAIGEGAFENCTWMSRAGVDGGVAFPKSLRRVGARAFYNCMELTSVVLPEGVRDVGDNAFYNCRGLISASLPHSVTNIGANAFARCAKLTGVTAPTGLKTLAEIFPDAFGKVTSVTVPDGEAGIMEAMFRGCESVTRFTIPLSVTNVGQSAFEKCSALPSLALPDDIVEIGAATFRDCAVLSVVSLPKNLQALPDEAFVGCGALESVIVPASVAQLGQRVFGGAAVTEVKYLGDAPDYESMTYEDVSNLLTSYIIRGSRGWDYAETGIRTSRQKPDLWIGHAIEYWEPNVFEVTFDGNGGRPETYVAEQITDTTYSLPKVNPTRDGYVFKGWWTEPAAGGEVTANTICVANRAHSLYAHWEAGATVEVSFNPCGGTVVPDVRGYVSGTTYGEFPVPTKRGYKFLGWFTAAEGGTRVVESSESPKTDRELFAHWTPCRYTIRFHAANGTSETVDQSFVYGESVVLRANTFSCPSCTFAGWALNPGGAAAYADGKALAEVANVEDGVIHLWACWTGNTYVVRFDSNGGEGALPSQAFVIGVMQQLLTNTFTRAGFVFGGWARTAGGAVMYLDGQLVEDLSTSKGKAVVLHAVWLRPDVARSVVFNVNGGAGTMPLLHLDPACVYKLPKCTLTPPKGKRFAGWAGSNGKRYDDEMLVFNLAQPGETVRMTAIWE